MENYGVGRGGSFGITRFNSATAVMPWKTGKIADALNEGAVLQFGHGGDAVENDGNRAMRCQIKQGLQFGHGGDAVENSAAEPREDGLRFASIRPRR